MQSAEMSNIDRPLIAAAIAIKVYINSYGPDNNESGKIL